METIKISNDIYELILLYYPITIKHRFGFFVVVSVYGLQCKCLVVFVVMIIEMPSSVSFRGHELQLQVMNFH